MPDAPLVSVKFHAYLSGSTACSVGNVLIKDSASNDYYVIATTANRGTRRSEGVAITAYGGSTVGGVQLQQTGTLPQEITGLSTGFGSKQLVRVSATGTLERIATGSVNTSTDDIIGYAEENGRVHLYPGWPFAELVALLGGSSITLGGSNGDVVIKASASSTTGVTGSNGDVLYKTGGVWGSTPALQVPSGSVNDPVGLDGTGGLKVISASSGAPVGAQYITLATDATLTNERVITQGAAILLTDGGAGGALTIAVSNLANAQVAAGAAIAYSKLNLASSIVNADVSASAAIASTKIALTSTRVGFGNGSNQMTDDAGLTYDATNDRLTVTGAVRVATSQTTTGVGIANNTGYYARNAANSLEVLLLQLDASNIIRIGDSNSNNIVFSYESTAGFFNSDSGVYDLLVNEDTDITYRLPRHGQSTPYASEGLVTKALGSYSEPGNYNVASAEYSRKAVEFTGTASGSGGYTITWPTPSNNDGYYERTVINAATGTLTMTLGAGTTVNVSAGATLKIGVRTSGVITVP